MAGAENEPVDADEVALHERTLSYRAFDRGSELRVVGHLRDARPWLDGTPRVVVHDMELEVVVQKADLVITEAAATMHDFPHAECPDISPVFSGLVGLSVARGYVKEVQRRFVGAAGCSHLDHLARGLGPAVIQALASSHAQAMLAGRERRAARAGEAAFEPPTAGQLGRADWLKNTCHIWADDGVGPQKVALGFVAIEDEYPVPPVAVLVRRRAGGG